MDITYIVYLGIFRYIFR